MTGPRSNGAIGRRTDEATPLLGSGSGHQTNWLRRMADDLCFSWTDAVLLACYVVTGLLDSSSIQVWGTFVSMQTGQSGG